MVLKRLDPFKGQQIEISKLSKPTRANLDLLEETLDVEWTAAYRFPVQGQNTSFLITGRGPGGEDVRFARVETGPRTVGQTQVYIDGKKYRLAHIITKLGGGVPVEWSGDKQIERLTNFPLESKISSKDLQTRWESARVSKDRKVDIEWSKRQDSVIKRYMRYLPQVNWNKSIKIESPTSRETRTSTIEGTSTFGERVDMRVSWGGHLLVVKFVEGTLSKDDLDKLKSLNKIPNRFIPIRDLLDILEESRSEAEKFRMEQEHLRGGQPRQAHNVESGKQYYDKYLKDLDRPGELYHITSRRNLQSILTRGLDSGLHQDDERWMGPLEEVTSSYFEHRGTDPVILRINLDKLDKSRLRDQHGGIKTYRGTVPPEAITEVRIPDFEL